MDISNLNLMKRSHWAEIILHADKDGKYAGLQIDSSLPAEIVETDLWVKKGDFVHGFEGANNAIGTLVMRFEDKNTLEEYFADTNRWLKVVLN